MAPMWKKLMGNVDPNEPASFLDQKPKLDNARRMRGIYSIDPSDEECEETINNARKRLEVLMEPAMPCKKEIQLGATRSRQLVRSLDAHQKVLKTRYGCFLESHESTRPRAEPSLPKHHDDHIAGKGYTSMTLCNLVHKFIPMTPAKIPDAKAVVDKEWKKRATIPAWQLCKLRSKKEDIL